MNVEQLCYRYIEEMLKDNDIKLPMKKVKEIKDIILATTMELILKEDIWQKYINQ